MHKINYNDRKFCGVQNTPNGEVSGDTVFHYRQSEDVVWGTYQGGAVIMGTLIATADHVGHLDMRYQHVNQNGELQTGKCHTRPEVLKDGRLRLHETWQWTSGDLSSGESIVEEIVET